VELGAGIREARVLTNVLPGGDVEHVQPLVAAYADDVLVGGVDRNVQLGPRVHLYALVNHHVVLDGGG
jgi:hypothetical protein